MTGLVCTMFLLTATPADDWLRVPPVAEADFYRATWNGQTYESPEPLFPVGEFVGTVRVVGVNRLGESPEPFFIIWAGNPGRRIEFDASNCLTYCDGADFVEGEWACTDKIEAPESCRAPLCGGP